MKKEYNIKQFEKAKLNELRGLADAFPIDYDKMEKEYEKIKDLSKDDPRLIELFGEDISEEEYQKLLNRPGEVSNYDIPGRI